MRVLLIGGTALIGPYLIRELSYGGLHDLHTLTRSGKRYYCENSHIADRRDPVSLNRAINQIKPDVIVDMIPFTAQDAMHLVASVTGLEIPIIAISSIDVYAAYASLHRTENLPLQPCPLDESCQLRNELGPEGSAYDKLSIEAIYNTSLNNICILRLPAIYGWPDCTRVDTYLDQMLDGAAVIALDRHQGDWKFSRCLHKNAAYAIALTVLAQRSGRHIYNVADERVHNERQWIERIANACGWAGSILESEDSAGTTNWLQNFYVSTEKIRSEMAYRDKYSTDEGLADTVAFHAYGRTGVTYKKYY
ncbi:MAG: NAD-dependent epimerase/dehydratase family protein [Granulosicoccus sp.]